jgi:hypothetical protein
MANKKYDYLHTHKCIKANTVFPKVFEWLLGFINTNTLPDDHIEFGYTERVRKGNSQSSKFYLEGAFGDAWKKAKTDFNNVAMNKQAALEFTDQDLIIVSEQVVSEDDED